MHSSALDQPRADQDNRLTHDQWKQRVAQPIIVSTPSHSTGDGGRNIPNESNDTLETTTQHKPQNTVRD